MISELALRTLYRKTIILQKLCNNEQTLSKTVFTVSHIFWYIVFSFVLRYFLISLVISLIHLLFKSVLFPHICVCSYFLSTDCLFHSNAIGKDICMFSILKNLLKLIMLSNVWLILENVPCTLEKNIYSDVGRNVLYMSVRPNSFI